MTPATIITITLLAIITFTIVLSIYLAHLLKTLSRNLSDLAEKLNKGGQK